MKPTEPTIREAAKHGGTQARLQPITPQTTVQAILQAMETAEPTIREAAKHAASQESYAVSSTYRPHWAALVGTDPQKDRKQYSDLLVFLQAERPHLLGETIWLRSASKYRKLARVPTFRGLQELLGVVRKQRPTALPYTQQLITTSILGRVAARARLEIAPGTSNPTPQQPHSNRRVKPTKQTAPTPKATSRPATLNAIIRAYAKHEATAAAGEERSQKLQQRREFEDFFLWLSRRAPALISPCHWLVFGPRLSDHLDAKVPTFGQLQLLIQLVREHRPRWLDFTRQLITESVLAKVAGAQHAAATRGRQHTESSSTCEAVAP